ncbi:MAG: hypothetical protein A3H42_06685 [Deltaproteobacteria bacterium RIFCSPLOWO2_02_FULL_46_8]|nr:MAG: hypothetical protein A3H42_06685 [Deltaproteobacteria bacterium RIFCSPLOWO2_02_FULL_46_8]
MPRLTESEALTLFYKTPLEELRARAGEQRCHFLPASKATYIVMRIVSYTNVCVADCRYCAFYRRPGNPEGYVLSREEIFKKIDELKEKGGSLVAMEGGLNPALEIEHYENLFRSVRERYGNEIEIYGPTAVEVLFIARNSKISVVEALERLRNAGLYWIPGGGAEILTDEWRRKLSPKKYSVSQYLETIEMAQKMKLGTTATMTIGFGEPFEARVEHLKKIRDLQDKTGGFASFLCWTYQSAHTALGGIVTSNEDYLRTVAVARLYLDNFKRIRASFLTQGPSGVQALLFGADDFDIVLEDQVTQKAGVQIEDNIGQVLTRVRNVGMEPLRRKTYAPPQ